MRRATIQYRLRRSVRGSSRACVGRSRVVDADALRNAGQVKGRRRAWTIVEEDLDPLAAERSHAGSKDRAWLPCHLVAMFVRAWAFRAFSTVNTWLEQISGHPLPLPQASWVSSCRACVEVVENKKKDDESDRTPCP